MRNILLTLLCLHIITNKLVAQDFNMQLRSHVPYPGYTCSSEWGYVDSSGNEYALVGTSFGVSIVDITNPDSAKVLFNVQHTGSFWREIKTYGHYAYATNENGGGVLIIDLSQLPDTFAQYSFIYTDGAGNQQYRGHELWIDEHGRLYIFGGNYWNGGATIFDLTQDPLNPPYLGAYENHYIHSGFVRGDTLWASEIYSGQVEVVNVTDPANCIPMAAVHTPSNFTHNSWPTRDDHYLFTTDEVSGAFVTSYDVSDLSNITELDRVQSTPGTSVIPHNVHLLNDTFAVTAYYCDGVVVFDVAHPDNMIKVASYDTWPAPCNGYNGTWGAYPYFPSGTLILSNIEDGLFVLTPTYVQACRLEGNVIDSVSQAPLVNVSVKILNTVVSDVTNLSGDYKTGYANAGNFYAEYSYPGYATRIVPVTLSHGEITIVNVKMKSVNTATVDGTVSDSASGSAIPFADVNVTDGGASDYSETCDANGNFIIGNPLNTGDYLATAGLWGYKTREQVASVNDPFTIILISIPKGYYDDFFFDNNWSVSGTAASGEWTRGVPVGTNYGGLFYNPAADAEDDFGNKCFVTGNGGGNPSDDDVDSGYTQLTSPQFDLSSYANPKISYEYWLASDSVNSSNDSLVVYLSNGVSTVAVDAFTTENSSLSKWVHRKFSVSDFIQPTSTMTISFYAVDHANENVFEAAIDRFEVTDSAVATVAAQPNIAEPLFRISPNPFSDAARVEYELSSISGKSFSVKVYDLVGKQIKSIQLTQNHGSVILGEEFASGVYLLRLECDGKTISQLKAVKTN